MFRDDHHSGHQTCPESERQPVLIEPPEIGTRARLGLERLPVLLSAFRLLDMDYSGIFQAVKGSRALTRPS